MKLQTKIHLYCLSQYPGSCYPGALYSLCGSKLPSRALSNQAGGFPLAHLVRQGGRTS